MLDNRIEKKSVEMNYRNYEGKIVEKYGVELKGWPTSNPGICNPATFGGWPQLEKLLAALESGQCHWVVLTDDELEERKKHNQAREERGEQVYRPRKPANRGTSNPKGAKSAETIEDDEDGGEEPTTKRARNDDEDEGEQEPATKRPRLDDDSEDNSDNDNTASNDD